jgi:hypothetical protein
MAACGGEVLSFDSTTQSPLSTGDAGSKSLATLTDDEALTLCQWVNDRYPAERLDAAAYASPAPGYVSGPGFGLACGARQPITWVLLSPADCVRNIRHSACTATPDDVARCVDYVVAAYGTPAPVRCDDAGTCGDACEAAIVSACSPLMNSPSCDETVFQAAATANGGNVACVDAMPVEVGATCAAP